MYAVITRNLVLVSDKQMYEKLSQLACEMIVNFIVDIYIYGLKYIFK